MSELTWGTDPQADANSEGREFAAHMTALDVAPRQAAARARASLAQGAHLTVHRIDLTQPATAKPLPDRALRPLPRTGGLLCPV